MGFYRKRPVVIQAIQWTGSNFEEISQFMGCTSEDYFNTESPCRFYMSHGTNELVIKTLEGDHTAKPTDYIIRGVQGEFYPCRENIFLATYETVV